MDATTILILLIGTLIGLVAGYLIIKSAVTNALRDHYEWVIEHEKK
jgi:ABC-type dipeptide/oligopeptide/nickel transport system permease subunit